MSPRYSVLAYADGFTHWLIRADSLGDLNIWKVATMFDGRARKGDLATVVLPEKTFQTYVAILDENRVLLCKM